MSKWYDVSNQSHIDYLKESYGDFHNSCITELRYISGADVDKDLSMGNGEALDRKLSVIFKRQSMPMKIELLFEGMRQMNIAGWQNHYFCEIFACYLKFHKDLIKDQDRNLIVWADNDRFNPNEVCERNNLLEPLTSYIISERLKWRLLE